MSSSWFFPVYPDRREGSLPIVSCSWISNDRRRLEKLEFCSHVPCVVLSFDEQHAFLVLSGLSQLAWGSLLHKHGCGEDGDCAHSCDPQWRGQAVAVGNRSGDRGR